MKNISDIDNNEERILSNLRRIIDASKGRYTSIGYKGKTEDRVMEVKQILSIIEKFRGKDGKNYYSTEAFERVQKILEEEERKKKETRTKTREDVNNNENDLFKIILSAIMVFFSQNYSGSKSLGKYFPKINLQLISK